MCGIAGQIRCDRSLNREDLMVMLPGIQHRGPDGIGHFLHQHAGLLHARLSIIDTSESANQPLFNEDRSLVVICNGEIYNYLSIRKELESKGHRFHCHSDTEVLVHLYEEHRHEPEVMLNKLKGMFSFAILDCNRNEMLLVRDRFGIKPLYYISDNTGFYFASELKSLVAVKPELKNDLDYTSLFEYYQFLSIPEPNTIYKGVKAVPAGHFVWIKNKKASFHSWYKLPERIKPITFRGFDDFAEGMAAKVESVTEEHLVSDVPLGSFLSAGIDSTMITHFASRHGNESFTAVTAGFPDDPEDESVIARQTAEKMKLGHFQAYYLSGSFFDDAKEVIRHFDQPFAVFSAFSLFRISKLARQHMKVVLTGDGGDEVFGGYNRHTTVKLPSFVRMTPPVLRPSMAKLLGAFSGETVAGLSRQYQMAAPQHRFLKGSRLITKEVALSLIPPEKRKEIDQQRFDRHVDDVWQGIKGFSWLHQILYADMATFLKSEMLYKVDRMTMANQLEGRVPLLDHEVVELAFSAPPEFLRNESLGKLPLRHWVEKNYPGLGSRPKSGFNTPLIRILQEDQVAKRELESMIQSCVASGKVDKEGVQQARENFEKGNKRSATALVSVACLGGWLNA